LRPMQNPPSPTAIADAVLAKLGWQGSSRQQDGQSSNRDRQPPRHRDADDRGRHRQRSPSPHRDRQSRSPPRDPREWRSWPKGLVVSDAELQRRRETGACFACGSLSHAFGSDCPKLSSTRPSTPPSAPASPKAGRPPAPGRH
jgi:hypothetical protein